MASWEDSFLSWAKAPGITEREKCENAETAVRKALDAHAKLSAMDLTVLAQGSYKNRTNVRQDSDVDLCVRLNSHFHTSYPPDRTDQDFGNVTTDFTFAEYRNLVQEALEEYFGKDQVTRGSKAFDIHANTYRIDADVVAALLYKRYDLNDDGTTTLHEGICFDTDEGSRIINYPEQNYANGLQKHNDTGKRSRKIIRILKRLRNRMQEEGVAAADKIASCLIEHLVWNVPNHQFGHDTLTGDVRAVLAHTFNNTIEEKDCKSWGEVNELHYLFRDSQPWTREQAHNFLAAAWDYLEFT